MVAKSGWIAKKVLLCMWWDCRGNIHYELRPKTKISIRTCIFGSTWTVWRKLSPRSAQFWPTENEFCFIRATLWEIIWNLIIQSSYSPGLPPSDYRLCLYIANDFAAEELAWRETCEHRLLQLFSITESITFKITKGAKHSLFDINRIIPTMQK